MEEKRACRAGSVGDGRLEMVSGKGISSNQVHTRSSWPPRSPDHHPTSREEYSSSSSSSSSSSKPWRFGDPEMNRRKRIARYKVYSIEGRVKGSIKNGFRWFKNKCSEIIHGY